MPFLGHPFRVLYATIQTYALAHVILTYGMSIGPGWGPSMLPTFLPTGEFFVTDKRYRRGRGVSVGDCVVYSIPVEPGEEGLKRVMGMPGDYVLLNSPPSTSPASLNPIGSGPVPVPRSGPGPTQQHAAAVDPPVMGRRIGSENMIQVPKGHCYVVGDNLPWSRDSRDFGPIPLALIKGKVIAKASFDGLNPFKWFTRIEEGLRKPTDRP